MHEERRGLLPAVLKNEASLPSSFYGTRHRGVSAVYGVKNYGPLPLQVNRNNSNTIARTKFLGIFVNIIEIGKQNS
jgi:hypothetical protein